jgi:hypothetical protein
MQTLRWLFAMTVLAALGLTGLWMALWGDAGRIGGGLPLLPASLNALIGRGMFALGGLACLGLLAWGLKLGPQSGRQD